MPPSLRSSTTTPAWADSLFVLFVSLALGAAVLGLPGAFAAPARPDRPNIILILTDDLDAKSISVMPQLKTLIADQGTTFTNFFVTYALCCPSRSSILRGQYVRNHQVLTNTPPSGGFEKFQAVGNDQSTIATWLKAAGYRTTLMGKYLNGYPDRNNPTYVPPGWDEWYSPVTGSAYGNYNYRMNENGRLVEYGNTPQDYLTDVLARKASDVIRRATRDGTPFFIYLATYAPHAPATPARRHANAFPNTTAPRPPSFNEADVSDKPAWVQDLPLLSPEQITRINEQYRVRLRSLLAVDDLLATLVDVLQNTGQLGRTYILFTSDNGFHLGEHRMLMGKNTAYDEDIRVPLIVRGPAVPARRTLEHLTLNIDLAPTFAELAGAAMPAFVDGRSLVPLLGATPPPLAQWRQAFLVEHYVEPRRAEPPGAGERRAPVRRGGGVPDLNGIRTQNAIYVEYGTGERELYNLVTDPYELQNLLRTVPADLEAQFAARLADLRRCAAAPCRTAENAPVPVIGNR